MYTETKLISHDSLPLHIHEWSDVASPVGIVQIVHGMNEHGARYQEFAQKLNEAGYIAVADDHRGFGATAETESELGHIDPEAGVEALIRDQAAVKDYIRTKFPDLPYFIYAHSMGSFIIRIFMTRHSADGIILSGSGMQPHLLLSTAVKATEHFVKKNPAKRGHFLNQAAFWGFNKTYPEKHKFSWLSRDIAVQEAYQNDPFCGPVVGTSGFFAALFESIQLSQASENFTRVPKGLPILLLSGTADPVGHYGKDIPKIAVKLSEAGVLDVTYKLYENARHELINEIGKETIIRDIILWLDQKRSEA